MQGWRSLKILCRFNSMGLYVTPKGILFMGCEVDVAFFMTSFMHPLLYPIIGGAGLHFLDVLLEESLVGAYSS